MIQILRTAAIAGMALFTIGAIPAATAHQAKADYIRSAFDMSKCLGVPDGNNGTRVRIENCDPGGRAQQQWNYNARTGEISNEAFPSKCLHKASGGWGRGNRIHLWSCGAGGTEMRTWRRDTAFGTINARENEGMCFRIEGSTIESGSVISLNPDCRSNSDMITWRMTSKDQQDCAVFDGLVRPNLGLITDMINQRLPYSDKINRRKTLVMHRATSVFANGCTATISADVTMKRKIRKDAHGTMMLTAKLHSLGAGYICLRDPKVLSVNLSNLTGVGENFYRRRGTKSLPSEMCVAI